MESFACNDCGHTILVGETPEDHLCGGCRRDRESTARDKAKDAELAALREQVTRLRGAAKQLLDGFAFINKANGWGRVEYADVQRLEAALDSGKPPQGFPMTSDPLVEPGEKP